MFRSYCRLVVGRPILLISVTFLISILLSALGIYLHYDVVDFNPSKGFETRGTAYSRGKIILNEMKNFAATNVDIYKKKILRSKRDTTLNITQESLENIIGESKEFIEDPYDLGNSTLEPITVNYDDYGVSSEPNVNDLDDACTQYGAVGKSKGIPYYMFDLLVKVVVEADDIFTLNSFRALCLVDAIVENLIENSNSQNVKFSQMKHSFNLPLISTCMNLSIYKQCRNLHQKEINYLKENIHSCRKNVNSSPICDLEMIKQANNLLLPMDLTQNLAAIILPLRHGFDDSSINFYEQLEKKLEEHFRKYGLKLKGVDFGIKTKKFQEALLHDSILSAASATLVLATFYIYSGSLFFTAIILSMIFLSMSLAFFAYTVILGIDFFPFLNLLVIVLMTSIGADDAFLLLSYYKQERRNFSNPWKPGDIYLPTGPLHIRCLKNSLKHSLVSMFITSATTAVAFLSNLSSDIVVLRCFGIYACLTVMFNFTLVLFILPSTIMITQSDREPISLSFDGNKVMNSLTSTIKSIRWLIILLGFVITIFSTYITFINPGLRLPEYNPTKLLVDSNPSEWFDSNSHLFNFEWKRPVNIQKYFIIDEIEIKEMKMFSVSSKPKMFAFPLTFSSENVKQIEKAINAVLKKSNQRPENSWISGFVNTTCSEETMVNDTCFVDRCIERLSSAFPYDLAQYFADGPLFDKNLSLIGYYLSIPSKVKLTAASRKVSEAFQEINDDCRLMKNILSPIPLRCLSSAEITRYYDIIERLWPSTLSSIVISLIVSLIVVVLCTKQLVLSLKTVIVICAVVLWTISILVLLGWQLSVVESTIIVLTIGLSFDFSLHMAASIKDSQEVYMLDKIKSAYHTAGTACILAACSSIVCGLPLLFASTAAFFQVGVMLIALGIISLLGALIMLPTCLLCFYMEKKIKIFKM